MIECGEREACEVGAGGEHSAGPVALLSGLNPQPHHLVKHFFSVALFGMTRLPLRKGLYGIWLAFMLLVTAVRIILPIVSSEGIMCALHGTGISASVCQCRARHLVSGLPMCISLCCRAACNCQAEYITSS